MSGEIFGDILNSFNPGADGMIEKLEWIELCCESELNLAVCVGRGGQAFTWTEIGEQTWANVIRGHLVIVSSCNGKVVFKTLSSDCQSTKHILCDYFRLAEDISILYEKWAGVDDNFRALVAGVRVLRVDPFECLISFICSQNNAIPRILKMIGSFKKRFGKLHQQVDAHMIYSFPTLSDLKKCENLQQELANMGFGYRARYIQKTVECLPNEEYLWDLRQVSYREAIQELLRIPGVGPKVADCIALFSLDKLEAVPIDTHMLKLMRTRYRVSIGKSLTDKVYREMGDRLRAIYGPMAGWAHSVLFTGQLKTFQSLKDKNKQ